jgi:hypothetical protein
MVSRPANSSALQRNCKAVAKSITSVKPIDKILQSFTRKEREALDEYYRKKLATSGKSTSSKTLAVISDMHVGSDQGLYSGYGPVKISKDQEKLRDWWMHCADVNGRLTVLLLNGEPCQGSNKKQLGAENWSSDFNETLDDAERLIKQWHYDNLVMTRGSGYHVTSEGWTNAEETLSRRLKNFVPYSGIFGQALETMQSNKGMAIVQEQGEPLYTARKHVDNYIFFDIYGRLFNAVHAISFTKWFAYKTTSLGRELADMEFSRGKWYGSDRNLDFLIRSHAHYFVHIEFSNSHGIISPAWQFPNTFQFRTGLAQYPSVGSVKITIETSGDISIQKYIMPSDKLPRPEVLHF